MKLTALSLLAMLVTVPALAQRSPYAVEFKEVSVTQVVDSITTQMGVAVVYEKVDVPAQTWTGTLRPNTEDLNKFLSGYGLVGRLDGKFFRVGPLSTGHFTPNGGYIPEVMNYMPQ